jgi:hypothetical protein
MNKASQGSQMKKAGRFHWDVSEWPGNYSTNGTAHA